MPRQDTTTDGSRPARRWWQFSLRAVMLITLLACILLGWAAWKLRWSHQHEQAFDAAMKVYHRVTSADESGIHPIQQPEFETMRQHWVPALLGDDELPYLKSLSYGVEYYDLGPWETDVDDEDLARITGLIGLEKLDLTRSQVGDAGLAHLAGHTELVDLNLRGTRITDEGLAHLPALKKLAWLNLSSTGITGSGLAYLHNCPELKYLWLECTLGMPPFELADQHLGLLNGIKSLRALHISQPQIAELHLHDLPMLRGVHVHSDIRHIRLERLPRLRNLESPYGCPLERLELKELPSLVRIELTGKSLAGVELHDLRELTSLTMLYLAKTDLTDDQLRQLEPLVQLEDLALDDTPISDDGLAALVGLSRLKRLTLTNTSIGDTGLSHLAGLKRLERLTLIRTKLSHVGVAALARLSALRELSLYETDITDAAVEHLATMQRLQKLWIRNTRITPEGYAALRRALPNARIDYGVRPGIIDAPTVPRIPQSPLEPR